MSDDNDEKLVSVDDTCPPVLRQFFAEFDKALARCLKDGECYRVTLATDERNVTVDIYEEKGSMKKFNEAIMNAVKVQSGIDVVKS